MTARRAYAVQVLFAAAVAVLTMLWASIAEADDDRGFTLDWQTEAVCDGSGVRRAVEQLLGAAPQEAASPALHARAQLKGQGSVWQLTVDVVQGTTRSSRYLEVASCAEAVGATALVLALAIDPKFSSPEPAGAPVAAARFGEPTQRSSSSSPTPPASLSSASLPVEAARHGRPIGRGPTRPALRATVVQARVAQPPSRWPTTGYMATTVALSRGALPGVSPGLALAAGLNAGPLRFSAVGCQYAQRTAEKQGTSGQLTVDLATVDLRAGWRIQPGVRWELATVAIAQSGRFTGSGHKVDTEKTPRFGWGAAGVGGTLGFRLTRDWLVIGEADALLPFRRTEFTLNRTTLYQPARVIGAVRFGIAYEIGERP